MSKFSGILLTLTFVAALAALAACGSDNNSRSEVNVTLTSFQVTSDKASVPAGRTRFTASNVHATDVHELAVLKVKDDGSFHNLGEVEDIDPGRGGAVTIDLKAGTYVLACLITPGEAGSTEDHLVRGMHIEFTVQ
jgi:hypothetical protein